VAGYSKSKVQTLLTARWPNVEFLDEGGNSFVFREPKARLAIKVLRRQDGPRFGRFRREVDAARQLGTVPFVVVPIDVNLPPTWHNDPGSAADIPYFTMPLLDDNLAVRLPKLAETDPRSRVALIVSICEVVAALHAKGLAHRDLKPDNILFDSNNAPNLTDFGQCIDLAERADDAKDPRLTASGEMVGSLTHRAPEFLRGRLDASDHRPADVFSLGRIAFAILVGSEPHGLTDHELGLAASMEPIRRLRGGGLLAKVVEGCLLPDPLARHTVPSLIQSLKECERAATKSGIGAKLAALDEDAAVRSLELRVTSADQLQDEQREAEAYARGILETSPLYSEASSSRTSVRLDGGPESDLPFGKSILGVSRCGLTVGPSDGRLPIPQASLVLWTGFDDHDVHYAIVQCFRLADGGIAEGGKDTVVAKGRFQHFSVAAADIDLALRHGLESVTQYLVKNIDAH
jgi:serine/threonine protein kinase